MTTVRIVGDVHGQIPKYLDLIKNCDYSIQVGDMAFDYSGLANVDCSRHMFIGGNHDNYDEIDNCDMALDDFGYYAHKTFPLPFFYVRGSFSIDCVDRIRNYAHSNNTAKTWWYEDELTQKQLEDAIRMYEIIKPQYMITHDCPSSVKDQLTNANVMRYYGWNENHACITQQALEVMFRIHQPEFWFFGHYHRNWEQQIGHTTFVCIDTLSYIDIEL